LRAALSAGPVSLRVRTRSTMYPSDELTLVAEVHGSVAPAERYVLSAHVQEPGTNDNASGVGDLSEMARVLATLVEQGAVRPKRTITMLFGLEIAQTRNFLADDSIRTRGVRWGLSLDMTGEDASKTGGTFLIEEMPDPSAIWTRGDDHHTEWGGRTLTKAQLVPNYYNDYLLARCLDQAASTGWTVRTNPFEGGSDHTPFLEFKKPGALFWHFTDVFYHTDGDRLDKVSKSELSNVGTAALVSVLTLTSADGPTARALVAEVERAAVARLDTELRLSRAAVASGGARAAEEDILRTWTDYYVASIHTMTDIEVGGSSRETLAAIDAAANRIRQAGDEHLAQLPR
jgi:aminopeptidase YwaD